jgi:hypothetical protein
MFNSSDNILHFKMVPFSGNNIPLVSFLLSFMPLRPGNRSGAAGGVLPLNSCSLLIPKCFVGAWAEGQCHGEERLALDTEMVGLRFVPHFRVVFFLSLHSPLSPHVHIL